MTEREALDILKDFDCVSGVFTEPKGHEVTATESEALDYLWAEWDYGYVPQEHKNGSD